MERVTEPDAPSERELLLGWLRFHRDALAAKCTGLTPDQMVIASSNPSAMTLLGLVRHITEMEHVYLVHALSGSGRPQLLYCTAEDPDGDFLHLTRTMTEPSLHRWRQECELADQLLAEAVSLDEICSGIDKSVRWTLLKTIMEYARHNGHADIVRERIDGVTGE